MSEDVRHFAEKLCSLLANDENIVSEKLNKYIQETDPRLIALINHELFSNEHRLTNYLKAALANPKATEAVRKKVINFISDYVESHYLYLVEHVKKLFEELISNFWKEQGRVKETAIKPIVTIIEVYDEEFLKSTEVLNPLKLHNDIMTILQTQKLSHGAIGECWHLLAVIQNKFTTDISPGEKKKVQEICFIQLKKYVNQDANLSTIASLLRALSKSLRENYLGQEIIGQLYRYAVALMMPLKSTYGVPVAALELIQARRDLFQPFIMQAPKKLFQSLRTYANHKNKEFSLKSLQVLIVIIQLFVKVISSNRQKHRDLFIHIQDKIEADLVYHNASKNKEDPVPDNQKGLNLLTIIRLLGIMAPLYLQYLGKIQYKKIFNYIIKKCTKKILKDNKYQPLSEDKNFYQIKYILYAQKQLKSFISALAQLIEQLQDIDYDSANQLEIVFIQAVKQSKAFLAKYKGELWEAMTQLIMSIHIKGPIFSKWTKKVISESLRECLDSNKLSINTDIEYIKMIEKAAELWKSLLNHSSWRSGALNEFTQFLMSNYEYLILNLDCGYRIKNQGEQKQEIIIDEAASQEEGIVSIFFMPNERIQIFKIEDYQYLSSLSLLFNQILINIDPSLYSQRIFSFYPLVLQRIKLYPKSLPLLRTLRTLNEFILKTSFFKTYSHSHKEICRQLLQKMKRFFSEGLSVVFKYQQQYFYELLKILLSFSQEVYFLDNYRIVKYQLADLIDKTLQIGQEINSLADVALKCLRRLFQAQKDVFKNYLSTVIPSLQKYINIEFNSQKEEMKAHLFLNEQQITRQSLSEAVLSFLGSLGGLCHSLVDNRNSDHISWDFDCHLEVQIVILNEPYKLNLTKMLNRACWLAVNGGDQVKIVACQFLHAIITYVIEEVVSNKMTKQNLAIFLDRILPTVLPIAGNSSHPSQQLIHTLLIQTVHFFANTKQPNSPDIQVILKHLLQLYNKSEDMGYLASKCLSQFIRWHIKQQPLKNGDVPVLKALISNIWSLASNKNAREGIVTFLVKLLKIIHRQKQIMNYYSLQLGFLILALTRHNDKIEGEFLYLIDKYTACLKRYMKLLMITDEGRKYKKARNIKEFLDWIYKYGFFSSFRQQRETSYFIWHKVINDSSDLLGFNQVQFLKMRADREKKFLFGSSTPIRFNEVEEGALDKYCWKTVGLGEIWLKMLEFSFFSEVNLVQFIDLECVYLVSFASFLEYVLDDKNQQNNTWNDQFQHAVISNFLTFLKVLNCFSVQCAKTILGKFLLILDSNRIKEEHFNQTLFNIMYDPERIIRHFNRDFLVGEELNEYIWLFINYQSLYTSYQKGRNKDHLEESIEIVFNLLESQLHLNHRRLIDFICKDESSGERKIKFLLNLLKTSYKYDLQKKTSSGHSQRLEYILDIFIEFILSGKIRSERLFDILSFLLQFKYRKVIMFIVNSIKTNNFIYQRFQKNIFKYIQNNWLEIREDIASVALGSIDHIKLIYVLMKKLNTEENKYFLERLPRTILGEVFLRDLLKINFLIVQNNDISQEKYYISYLQNLIEEGLKQDKSIEVHQQTLYLCGLLLQKTIRLTNINIKTLKVSLNTLGNKYCPYVLTKLDNPEKQQVAMRYFSIVRNFLVIAEQFIFIEQFFIELKDRDLRDYRLDTMNDLLQDCVRTCFTLDNAKPRQWCDLIFGYFLDENIDKDEWCNFRLSIIDKLLRKVMSYIKVQLVQQLFEKYTSVLYGIIKRPLSGDSIKSLLLDFQIKKAALLIIELFYGNLPKRQKKEGQRQNQAHKGFIKECVEIVKGKLEESRMKLIKQHDQNSKDQTRKAINLYRQYNCYAYNCLVIIFISTQSKKQHFKSFLFESKQCLWDNLVNTQQTEFGFEVETEFKVMKPYNPLRNKLNKLKSKIQKHYFESSLYVVEEEMIPRTQLAKIEEENEDEEEKEAVPVNNANNIMLNTEIEEDIINRHLCMVNLLRVVDFLNATFPEPIPVWMGPIQKYLDSYTISLAQQILLIKLILNRPAIFNQPHIWSRHLLNYLSQKQTGGKFIHYFYRDTLKLYIKFLPDLTETKPDISKINTIIMKLVRSLPHDNVNAYIDNVDMLEALLKIEGAFVERGTINKMLKGDEKDQSRNQWKLCAIIVVKLCLTHKVPILSEEEYTRLRDRPLVKYSFYYQHIKQHMKSIFQMASQTGKKYRIAASGLLGQFLNFILSSPELSQVEKKDHFDSVSQFLNSLTEKKSNRNVKERFSLALDKIAARFPQIFADERLFASFEDGLVHYSGQERFQLIDAFKMYVQNLLSFNDTGKIANFFMILRVNWEKISVDILDVQFALLQLLNICTDPRVLANKDILKTFSIILEHFDKFIHLNESLAKQYFLILINIKKFLTDRELPKYDFHQNFLKLIEHNMVEGLTCKFEEPFKLLFSQFEKDVSEMLDADSVGIYSRIFKKIYTQDYEYLWLNSVAPLLLTLSKSSSDYKRLFTQAKLEENMLQYDWDFRNFRINDASLPYTPFSMRREGPFDKSNLGVSQMPNLKGGLVRATQNMYMSQEEQIFTMLESLSPSLGEQSQSQQFSQSEEVMAKEEQKYGKINDLFKNRRKRNQLTDELGKDSNQEQSSAAVRYVEDKIRFAKIIKVQQKSSQLRHLQGKEKVKKGAILRAYKIGELPNIEISLQNIIQPLIYLTSKDFELSGQIFLQMMETLSSFSLKNTDSVKNILINLIQRSSKYSFNFISTLQKGLIKICQKHKKFFDISLKDITIHSNTLDYAILFTEQNLIQGAIEIESIQSMQVLNQKKEKLISQWSDLADYYQLLNEHDLIESVIIKLLEGDDRNSMIKALKQKREGDLGQAKKIFEELMIRGSNRRLNEFISRQKIDCTVLLSEWDQICKESTLKREDGVVQSFEELRMYTIALQNLDPLRRAEFMRRDKDLTIPGDKYEYERGIMCVMKEGGIDGAKYHALNSRTMFRDEWLRVSSFAFNSKHEILQSLQKNYELIEFVNLYKETQSTADQCKSLFSSWTSRHPDTIFDDNITWIQILSSRLLYNRALSQQHEMTAEQMARSITEWHVQVVNGMLAKGVLGYAQNMIRKALQQHKLTKEFNWEFYESISKLKLLQLLKKGSMKIEEYSIVPKLIQKEMDLYSVNSDMDKFRLTMIKNEYFQGYLQVSLRKRKDIDYSSFVCKVIETFNNYQEVRKGLKNSPRASDQFKRQVHFDFAIFLQNLLSIIRGKFQIKQIKDSLDKNNYNIKLVATKFIEELVYSIKILNLNSYSTLDYEESQQVFSMILKLIKILQSDHAVIGKYFEDAITDKQIPKWIFLYFIPQIIRNINNYDLSIHLKELFQYFLANYPQALVYPFNCSYPREGDCHTELAQHLYRQLHDKMHTYFDFIQQLFVLQHPEMRLKDILTKYLSHGQFEKAMLELQEFINPSKGHYLGKYNHRFNENYKKKIEHVIDLKRRGLHKDVSQTIRSMILGLDPSKCNMMKYFTKLSDGSLWFEEYNMSDWTKLEVPGITYNQFEQPLPWHKVLIESFDSNILTLTSIRKPKRISFLGSNEKTYMLLVKGGEDVRLDQRIEELFELVNRIFSHFPETNRKQLKISRFEVIPMKPMFGVFEWVDKSQTLRNFLQTELRIIKGKPELNLASENQAFTTFVGYLNKLSPGNDKYNWHKALMMQPQQSVVRNMNRCQNQLPYGLLRFSLQRLAKDYDSFLHIKNSFISNYAALSLVTYILGIGDRHLENFLVQTSTGKIVMIDFGYSFGASVELPIPELIPFRLTRSIIDLTKPIGLEGAFRKSLLACYEALHTKMQLVVDYCDVFVDDPLMEWVWVSRKQLASSSNQPQPLPSTSLTVSQDAPEKRIFSNKIKIVQNKLRGYHPRLILQQLLTQSKHRQAPFMQSLRKAIWGKAKSKEDILSGEDLVSELISLAGDKNITGRSYVGLNLFV